VTLAVPLAQARMGRDAYRSSQFHSLRPKIYRWSVES
jgi:hypothetical protein